MDAPMATDLASRVVAAFVDYHALPPLGPGELAGGEPLPLSRTPGQGLPCRSLLRHRAAPAGASFGPGERVLTLLRDGQGRALPPTPCASLPTPPGQ